MSTKNLKNCISTNHMFLMKYGGQIHYTIYHFLLSPRIYLGPQIGIPKYSRVFLRSITFSVSEWSYMNSDPYVDVYKVNWNL